MKPSEFVDLVRRMRDAQRRYFKTRDRGDLDTSRQLEREVDRAVEAIQQPGLFGGTAR
jgi:hypothetical protein